MGNGTEQFDRTKEKTTYAEIKNIIDITTGELIAQESKSVKTVQAEPNFVKVYLNTVLTFQGIRNISTDFLLMLCNYVTYANDEKTQMKVIINRAIKDEVCQKMGIKINMIDKYIRKCVDSGILFKTEYRGTFIVNPFLIARGEWKNIKSLRTKFDFVNGEWKYVKQFKTNESENESNGDDAIKNPVNYHRP